MLCVRVCMLQELIAASDLYGEGYVDMDEFLAAMVANSSYSKTKDAVRTPACCCPTLAQGHASSSCWTYKDNYCMQLSM